MSISYVETGRKRQKLRTREAIIAATRELLTQSANPTVEQAADAAGVSRATAYRYFPNQRDLLVATHPEIDVQSLLADDAPDDVTERLDLVIDAMGKMVIDNEPELRTALRLSLESDATGREQLVLRQGRAIGWLDDALRPLQRQIPKREVRRLVHAIRCAVGIEALVWLCDVAGLSRKDAVAQMRWSARTLLASVLNER